MVLILPEIVNRAWWLIRIARPPGILKIPGVWIIIAIALKKDSVLYSPFS